MILILLGTQNKPYQRILNDVASLIDNKKIKEEVIAQTGCTEYKKDNMTLFDYIKHEEMDELIEKASVVIIHGGVGSITNAVKKGKKVIVAPRYKKYGEHVNDHQLQITKEFVEKGYVLPYYDGDNLLDIIKKAKKFKPNKYESNKKNFAKAIEKYIESL